MKPSWVSHLQKPFKVHSSTSCILGHGCGTWKQWDWIIQRLNPLQVQRGGQYSALSRSSKQDSRCWKLEQSLVTYTLNFNCFFQPLPSHLWSSSSWNVKSVMPARFSWLCLCRIKDICVTVEREKKCSLMLEVDSCFSNSKFWSFILFSSEMPWIQKIITSVTILSHDLLMSENL